MKYYLMISLLISSSPALASKFECIAEKSLLIHNPDTGKVDVRMAKTASFAVTKEPHEDPKTMKFIEQSGVEWGSVEVSTGTPDFHMPISYASAIVERPDGNIASLLTLRLIENGGDFSATTLVFDDSEGPAPSLTLSCNAR